MKRNKHIHASFFTTMLLLASSVLITLCGCGGGTIGTDNKKPTTTKHFVGTVSIAQNSDSSTSGSMEEDTEIHVIVAETGDSVLVDSEGRFSFDAALPEGNVTLIVEGEGFSSEVVVSNIPQEEVFVVLDIIITTETGLVAVNSVEITASAPIDDEEIDTPDEGSGSNNEEPNETDSEEEPQEPSTRTITIKGVVKDQHNNPVSDLGIRIKRTSISAKTNKKGKFTLKTKTNDSKLSLRVNIDSNEDTVNISNIPNGDITVNLVLEVSVDLEAPSDRENGVDDGVGGSPNGKTISGVTVKRVSFS